MQNKKVVEHYKTDVLHDAPAIFKSHLLSEDDLLIRKHILRLLCKGKLYFDDKLFKVLGSEAETQLHTMQEEGLVTLSDKELQVTDVGKAFIRNIAMILDIRLKDRTMDPEKQVFSKAI